MPGARVATGERVTLRTVESEDIPFIQRASANPEIRYPIGNPIRNRDEIDVSTERGTEQFLVCLESEKSSPGQPESSALEAIGQVNLTEMNYKRPELGYWISPHMQGKGYGKEAVTLVVDHAFRSYDTPAIGAEAYDFNEASRELLESLGFTREGCRRKFMFVDGAYRDMIQYGLLREKWRDEP